MRRPPALSLEAELEGALADAVGGDPYGPPLARRLETIARAVLHRRAVRGARVIAESGPQGTVVTVLLPAPGARVRQLVLHVDAPGR